MGSYVVDFGDIDQTQGAVVGGKGANLGELWRIDGIRVPPGFCVTTDAFERIMAEAPSIDDQLERLSRLDAGDRQAIGAISAEVRRTIRAVAIPDDLAADVTGALRLLGGDAAYAVRSSATAEDLPTASFAGQQDSYLNVIGSAAVLDHVSRCWASLFTERAVTYRQRNGFDHRNIHMAVVVQQMVFPDAAGILFTADPITSNRKVASVEASFGLGEALVSGIVNADSYQVGHGEVMAKTIGSKRLAIHAEPGGGTSERAIEVAQQDEAALTDDQVVRLARLGRRIEAHFGHPQDIEWCLVDDDFLFVQTRPITTLFPVPDADDAANHLYVSVGHQQMMTDAMKPLGLSMWKLSAKPQMYDAGGRLFVDAAPMLATSASRAGLLAMWRSDPLTGNALQAIVDRGDFIPLLPDEGPAGPPAGGLLLGGGTPPLETDPAIVDELIAQNQMSIASLKQDITSRVGGELFDFILADIDELKRILFDPLSFQVFMSAMDAAGWLNEHLEEWLGEKSVADTLTQSVPNNITSEMGLALLHVADVIRPHHDVVAFLQIVEDDDFLDAMGGLDGGPESRGAMLDFLDTYGMRCVGEIDITRPRWSERPTELLPVILGNIKNLEPGAGERRFEQGRREAVAKEQSVLERLAVLPGGADKAAETKAKIDRVRTFIGYREYPKYGMVCRTFVYKQALLAEAARQVTVGVLGQKEDIFFLTFQEFQEVVRAGAVDDRLITERKDAFRSYATMTPPRVFTSDGEVITGSYQRDDVPAGALVGLAVSAGTVEGRARVIHDIAEADLGAGDILVTAFTDPSWTPLFLAIAGLVTEVGGLMTHGAVIAREYGLPAVVGVENATRLIRDGQRIRVHGTDGYVEILTNQEGAVPAARTPIV
jgi:pyruvate,water dikinase